MDGPQRSGWAKSGQLALTAPTQPTQEHRSGISLIELLVILAIIGLLLALLVPAVQAARESARRMECVSHLKQIGMALSAHADEFGHYPSSGWGWKWPPIPARGDGVRQPGSWVYSILPEFEQQPLWEPVVTNDLRLTIPLAVFYCPSRRANRLYPLTNNQVLAPQPALVAKSDYAACAGDHGDPNAAGFQPFVQPDNLDEGDNPDWWASHVPSFTATGVIFQRSRVRPSDITDGLSQTYLAGEKLLDPLHYTDGAGLGDLESVYHGDNDDTSRVVASFLGGLKQDTPGFSNRNMFGGPHPAGCNFVFADGSVHSVSFAIDVEVHRRFGNRQDGLAASLD